MRPILRAVFVSQDIEGFQIDQTAEVLNTVGEGAALAS